jgi:hypothetical protein
LLALGLIYSPRDIHAVVHNGGTDVFYSHAAVEASAHAAAKCSFKRWNLMVAARQRRWRREWKKKNLFSPFSLRLWLLKRVFAVQGVGEEEDGRMKERVVTLAEEQSASGTEPRRERENVGGQSIWYNGSPDETREGACITERWAMSTPCQISQPGSSPKTLSATDICTFAGVRLLGKWRR